MPNSGHFWDLTANPPITDTSGIQVESASAIWTAGSQGTKPTYASCTASPSPAARAGRCSHARVSTRTKMRSALSRGRSPPSCSSNQSIRRSRSRKRARRHRRPRDQHGGRERELHATNRDRRPRRSRRGDLHTRRGLDVRARQDHRHLHRIRHPGNTATATFAVWVQFQAPANGTFFQQPINPDGSSIFKLGSTVPVKFKLQGDSAGIANLAAHLSAARISNSVTGSYVEAALARRGEFRRHVPLRRRRQSIRLQPVNEGDVDGHLVAARRSRRPRHPHRHCVAPMSLRRPQVALLVGVPLALAGLFLQPGAER